MEVKILRFNKGLLAILTLFVIIMSATAVSAIDDTSDVVGVDDVDNGDLDDIENDEGDDTLYDGDDDGADDAENGDEDGDEDLDVGDNPYRHGEKTPNEKALEEDMAAANAAGSDDAKQHQSSAKVDTSATGNPVVVLLAAMAIIGTGLIRSRK